MDKAIGLMPDRDQQSTLMKTLKDIECHHQEMEIGAPNDVPFLWNRLRATLAASSSRNGVRDDIDYVISDITRLSDETSKQTKIQHVLRSLKFTSMYDRDSAIKGAYAKTLSWIFDSYQSASGKYVPFKDWLCTGQGVFWIRGKPGSGKSTLMKYLVNDAQLIPLLQKWAGQSPIFVAKFYFWYSGTRMQKSQEGLLQSLLFEVLRQCPNTIADVAPSRWLTPIQDEGSSNWTRAEIVQSINDIAEHQLKDCKFCFFIDGLDEYEGDHLELVDTIKSLSSLRNIKICVASRPWNVFEKAFRPDTETVDESDDISLLLQDYTMQDMRRYVRASFECDRDFIRFSNTDHRYEKLLEDLVTRAEGVFLWVYLAVVSLKRGLTNWDTLTNLQKRLDNFPPSLEEYFQRMLDSIDNFYRPLTSQMLLVALHAKNPLHLWIYGYLDETDPNSALGAPIQHISDENLLNQLTNFRKRLNAQCQDLLETIVDDKYPCFQKVEFLHRTVRDFLTTRTIQQLLVSRLEKSFDAKWFLCRALLAQMKTLTASQSNEDNVDGAIFRYAKEVEMDSDCSEHELLDETERVAQWNFFSCKTPRTRNPMVVKALSHDMPCYVMHRISRDPSFIHGVGSSGAPALYWTIFLDGRREPVLPFLKKGDVAMAKLLLSHGADPNQRFNAQSVWGFVLTRIHENKDRIQGNARKRCFEMFKAMLAAGADPKLRLDLRRLGSPRSFVTLTEIIDEVFSEEQAKELKMLMQPTWTSRVLGYFGYKLASSISVGHLQV